jgi:hypothetical protein
LFQNRNYQNAGTEELEKLPPVQIKVVPGAGHQFVALGFQRNLDVRYLSHCLDPFPVPDSTGTFAALWIALRMRE